jgi:cytochrome b561
MTVADLAEERRYSAGAIVLHWAIAILILIQIGLGWYFNHAIPDHSPEQDQLTDIHISIGLTALLLILVRIGWRLTHPAPPLPSGLHAWEKLLAHTSHLLFYALMLAMPLTGWALVSARGEDIPFWGLEAPPLPGLAGVLVGPAHRAARHQLQDIHTDILVWIALANLALHIAGALKHQFDGHPVVWRMLPGARPRP